MRKAKMGTAALASAVLTMSGVAKAVPYTVINLVSNDTSAIPALVQNPNLINPWGVTFKGASPIWIAENNSGSAATFQINSSGTPVPGIAIGIPDPTGAPGGTPTGVVGNPTANGFQVGGTASAFIFGTEDGTVAAWAAPAGTATVAVNNSASGAVYKGLASGTGAQGTLIYASNFNSGHVDVFDSNFQSVNLGANAFVDPNNPNAPSEGHAGFAPFGIQNIGGSIFVTYALQDAQQHDDVAGAGNGFVDIFNTSGVFQQRLITGGALNSPWGLTLAPAAFGQFGGDLLVGNFGNSRINAYDPTSGNLVGTLDDALNNPLLLSDAVDAKGLWGITFGNGAKGFDANTLYIASGANDEKGGLFAAVTVPEPGSLSVLVMGGMAVLGRRKRRVARELE